LQSNWLPSADWLRSSLVPEAELNVCWISDATSATEHVRNEQFSSLLGHTKIESMVRYLGIQVDGAIARRAP
jgi:hypothetical protein